MPSSSKKKQKREAAPRRGQSVFKAFRRLYPPLVQTGVDAYRTVLDGGPSAGTHRLRVTLRRLRSLLWAFAPALPKGRAERWRKQLGRAASAAGAVRDWDVLIEDTLPKAPLEPGAALDEFVGLLHRAREERRVRGLTVLRELEVDRLLRDCGDALATGRKRWRKAERPIRKFARRRLKSATRALSERVRFARNGELDALHEARIALKRVRYLTEFFGPLLRGSEHGRLDDLVELQERLGRLNDRVVAVQLLDELTDVQIRGPVYWSFRHWLESSIASDSQAARRRIEALA